MNLYQLERALAVARDKKVPGAAAKPEDTFSSFPNYIRGLKDIEHEMRGEGDPETEEPLIIGCCYGLDRIFERHLTHFYQSSGIRMQWEWEEEVQVLKGLKNGKYKLAFCSVERAEKGLIWELLGEERLVGLVPEGHKLAAKPTAKLEDLLHYPQIVCERCGWPGDFAADWLQDKEEYLAADEMEVSTLVAEGKGVAVVPADSFYSLFPIRMLCLEPLPCWPVYAVCAEGKEKESLQKSLRKYLKSVLHL